MKKFFKALALVLALTLVIGCIPASAAEKKVKSSKVLYVGGAQGESADGTIKSALQGRVAIRKLAGYTAKEAKEHTFKAELVSGADIICGKKYVKATNLGKSVVAIYVDGEKVGETTITSKVNASEETLVIKGLEGDTVVVGKEYTISLPRATKDSDERRLFINGEEVKEADPAKAARVYKYTFAKVGEYTIKAEAFQSTKLDKALVSKEIKVNAINPVAKTVEQVASNAVKVTFSDEIALTKDMVSLYYMAGDAKVFGNVVSKVEAEKDNKAVWTITFFTAFTAKTEYNLVVDGTELQFTGAGVSADDVKSVKLSGDAEVIVNKESKAYTYKFYNEAGMDITSTVDQSKFSITLTSTDVKNGWFTGDKIYFWEKGETATIKVTVQKLNDNYEYVTICEDAMTVKSIAEPQTAFNGVAIWSLTNVGADRIKTSDTANTTFAVGDEKALQVIFNTVKGTEKGTVDALAGDPGYRFESADPTIALVTGTDAKNSPIITAISKGTAYIKVYSVDTANKVNNLITAIAIKVDDARKVSSVTATPKTTKINHANATTVAVDFVVKDQYGAPVEGATVKITKSADNYLTNLGGFAKDFPGKTNGEGKVTITADITYVKDGTYTINATAEKDNNKATATTAVSVLKQADVTKVNGYELASFGDVDLALVKDTKDIDNKSVALKATFNGYFLKDETVSFTKETPKPATGAAATTFVYTVAKDGKLMDTAPVFDFFTAGAASGTAISKFPTGKYVITAYKVVADPAIANCKVASVGQVSFAVTDNQLKPSFTQTAGKADLTKGATAIFNSCFTMTFNGKTYDDMTKANADGYYVTDATAVIDSINKTVVFTKVTMKIEVKNGKADGLDGNFFEIKDIPVSGIVYGE